MSAGSISIPADISPGRQLSNYSYTIKLYFITILLCCLSAYDVIIDYSWTV